jgi:hypothetical protein
MLSGSITLLTAAGTVFTAYQAYQQDVSDRQIVVLCAVGGLVASIFLQTCAGKFSKEEKSFGTQVVQVLIKDFTSALSSVVLPFSVAYGYVKKNADTIARTSLGLLQIAPAVTLRGRDVTHLYPALVGVNLGFLIGQMVGGVLAHITKG